MCIFVQTIAYSLGWVSPLCQETMSWYPYVSGIYSLLCSAARGPPFRGAAT